uniref:Alpha-ketoglutarate dehydrogenase subunit 4 n=1 Tax=Sarcophilus harrisii TaxID=9305 RepID=A0A7N4PAG0_SARHA
MGSKMAAATRVVQVVKPHSPLIRFPDRKGYPKLNVPESFTSSVLPSHSSTMSQHSLGGKSSGLPMNRGPPDSAEIVKTLPQKYRRKFMSPEEMEFIQVCVFICYLIKV